MQVFSSGNEPSGRRVRRRTMAVAFAVLGLAPAAQAATPDPDPTFASQGFAVNALGGTGQASISDVATLSDGRIVVAGTTGQTSSGSTVRQFVVARFTSFGTLDTTFNPSGPTPGAHVSTLNATDGSRATALVVLSGGQIVAAGTAGSGATTTAVVQRYTADGTLDATFGSGGRFSSSFGQAEAEFADLVARSDGRLVLAGSVKTTGGERRALLAQLTTTGALDPSFAVSGTRIQQLGTAGSPASQLNAVALDSADRPVTAGSADDTALYARWTATGTLNVRGTAPFAERTASAQALVLAADGTATVAGGAAAGGRLLTGEMILARFTPSGTLDGSFGPSATPGRVTQMVGDGDLAGAADLALLPGGGVRTAGYALHAGQFMGLVAQYTASGGLDTTFDANANRNHRLYPVGDGGHTLFSTIVLLPSGRYLVAGQTGPTDASRALLARLGGTAQAPTAAFVHAPAVRIRPGDTVSFDGRGSSDPDGSIVQYEWDLDNNGSFETGGATPTSAYSAPGDYPIRLRVTDTDGLRAQVTRTVSVTVNTAPTAEVHAQTSEAPRYGQNFPVSGLTSSDSDGNIVRYEWSVDGKAGFEIDTGKTSNLNFKPAQSGKLPVVLRVTDDEGAVDEHAITLDVAAPTFELELDYLTGNADDGLLLKKGQTGYVRIGVLQGPGATGPYDHTVEVLVNKNFGAAIEKDFAQDSEDRILAVTAPKDVSDGAAILRVRITSSPAEGSLTRELDILAEVVPDVDPRIIGIELNQGIQSEAQPCDLAAVTPPAELPENHRAVSKELCTKNRSLPDVRKTTRKVGSRHLRWSLYHGIELVEKKKTVVRVFANTPSGSIPGYTAILYGYDHNGKALKGSPINTVTAPMTLKPGLPYVTFLRRTDPAAAMAFVLPPSWTKADPVLEAKLVSTASGATATACGKAECLANDRLALMGLNSPSIPFTNTGYIRVGTAALEHNPGLSGLPFGDESYETPARYFEMSDLWAPLRDGGLHYDRKNWKVQLTVPDEVLEGEYTSKDRRNALRTFLDDYADDNGCGEQELCADQVVGVYDAPPDGGVSMGGIVNSPQDPVAVSTDDPKTVAHELFHGWGHTPHTFTDEGCLGSDESAWWEPDQTGTASDASGRGRLEGIGLDTRGLTGTSSLTKPFEILAPSSLGAPPGYETAGKPVPQQDEYYDVLSYCGEDDEKWISVGGWRRLIEIAKEIADDNNRSRRRSVRQVPGRVLRVQAELAADGAVSISSVKPREGRTTPPGEPGYALHALAADGRALAQAPISLSVSDEGASLTGEVAAAGAVAVAIVRDGAEVARRAASPAAPTVRVLSPRRGDVVGAGKTVTVRWRATDGDGDALVAKVDYSADGGRTWRPVAVADGLAGSATLPNSAFAGSRRAQVRVRVNDGFNQTEAQSGRFRTLGSPPSVAIGSPAKLVSPVGAPLYLTGSASDDRGWPLAARRMTWFAGPRRLGTGPQISVDSLPAGTHRVRLVARAGGRTGKDTVSVRIRPAVPLFLRVSAPAKVSRRARSVRLTVTSSIPATLRVGRNRYRVGRRARKVSVPVKPGKRMLVLPLSLGSGKLRSTQTVRVARP